MSPALTRNDGSEQGGLGWPGPSRGGSGLGWPVDDSVEVAPAAEEPAPAA